MHQDNNEEAKYDRSHLSPKVLGPLARNLPMTSRSPCAEPGGRRVPLTKSHTSNSDPEQGEAKRERRDNPKTREEGRGDDEFDDVKKFHEAVREDDV